MATSGIGIIKNIENEKIFAFKSFNLEKQWKIYQKQLNLDIHHNIRLQKDWNAFGSENFEFGIIEEIDDEFFLEDGFVDYVSHLNHSYNSFLLSEFILRYNSESKLFALYDLIGKEECNPQFLKKLKDNDLPIGYYDEIKNEMTLLINDGVIDDNKINEKLNEIIQEKSHSLRIFNLDMQYKLMNDLEEIVGIYDLSNDFKLKLDSEDLPEVIGFEIRDKIMELIFSNNVVDNDINKQIDSCIEVFKQRVSKEVIERLTIKADSLKKDDMFINKLHAADLTFDDGLKIIEKLKEFINVGIITEDSFSERLDELINIAIENQINSFSKGNIASSSATPRKYVYCSQCGHKNISNTNFCEECGEKLD